MKVRLIKLILSNTWGQFNFGIHRNSNCGIAYLKKGTRIENLELKFATKKLNPLINLPFNFLIRVPTPISDWSR